MRTSAPARGALAASAAAVLLLSGCSDDTPSSSTATTSAPSASVVPEPGPEQAPDAAPEDTPPAEAPTAPPGSSLGGVVEGYPVDLLPPLPDATVLLTSAVPAGDLLQVTLAAATPAPAEEVLVFYRDRLVPAGFVETPGPAGATGGTFTRGGGREVVTVAVVSADGQQQYTVGGAIAAG